MWQELERSLVWENFLKTGCTTSNDHFYAHPRGTEHLIDVQIEAAKDLGIRFHPTRGSLTVGKSNGSPHVPDTFGGDNG